jgi:hypothetical protein
MRNKQQQLAREWSRMNAVDRAMSKAIHQGEHDGGRISLMVMVQRALRRGEEEYQKQKRQKQNNFVVG